MSRNQGIFAIVMASFLWGTTGTVASFSQAVSPLATGAFAMGSAGFLLLLSAGKTLQKDLHKLKAHPGKLLCGALSVAIYSLAFYSSMALAGVVIGTVVSIASAPFFAVVLERVFNAKPITGKWIISAITGAVGIGLLSMGKSDPESSHSLPELLLGTGLACIAGLTYAVYSWVAKALIDHTVDARSAMSALFGLAACVLLPSLWLTGDNLFATPVNTGISIYMALGPMFAGYLLFGYGLKVIEASEATLLTLIEPLAATLLAMVVLKENFSPLGWVGAMLIVLCLIPVSIQTERAKSSTATKVSPCP